MKLYSKILNGIKFLYDADFRWLYLAWHGKYDSWDDEKYLKKAFECRLGKPLDLNNPRTFNEKLQWLKLYDRKPEYTIMVDKYAVKKYVADIIGEEYIIPTLGVWNHFDEIDFDKLPNQFVLKCTHDSGGLVICKDKNKLDLKAAKKKIEKSLKRNYYWHGREWPYKDVKPQIIAEKYMSDDNTEFLTDYKFFTFNGVPKIMYIAKDHSQNPTPDFFDMNFNRLNIRMEDPNSENSYFKPELFDKMKLFSEKLASESKFLRVDFYVINKKLYFGELTFFHMSGFAPIYPEKWSYILGDWIKLPKQY